MHVAMCCILQMTESTSSGYRLRPRILFQIFSFTKKITDKDDYQDNDGNNIKTLIELHFNEDAVGLSLDSKVDQIKEWFEKLPSVADMYDCFFFIFLAEKAKDSGNELRLMAYDKVLDLETIFDATKKPPSLVGKPKIFLVKADDEKLAKTYRTKSLGDTRVVKKIPQDSDRLIILSTLPQVREMKLKPITKDGEPTQCEGSFLVHAFCSVLNAALKCNIENNEDFLTRTTQINKHVKKSLEQLEKYENNNPETNPYIVKASELPVPLVISTLRKLLYFNVR